MSFDFAVDTTEVATTDEDTEETPDFENNEVAEIYISGGEWKALLKEMLEAMDLEELKIYSDDTLDDVGRLLSKYEDAHPQQKLHMIANLMKSTAGKMQRENDHAIGLRNGEAPDEHFENSFSYALHFKDLPSITWDDLDGGERENLEELGVDPSGVGFDRNYGGPKLLVVNGNRVPIAVEDGSEIQDALGILQQIPDEPSKYTEDGFVESSDPSVFGETDNDDTDKVSDEETDDSGNDVDDISLAANPERIQDFTVEEIKREVTDISNLRAIQTMLSTEADADKTRSTAMKRLKERRNALRSSTDEDDTEEAKKESDDETEDSVDDGEGLSDADKNLISALLNSGEVENFAEAKQMVVEE